MIVLTDFVAGARLGAEERWSGARWAPSFASDWPKAAWAAPLRDDGSAIKLRDFGSEPLAGYREYMLELYRGRWESIRQWLGRAEGKHIVLACWCPNTKTARMQLETYGTFHCHLAVIAEVCLKAEAEFSLGTAQRQSMVRHNATWTDYRKDEG